MSSTQEVGDIFGAGKGHAQDMLRSPTVLIVSIGLWGMNLFFFRLFGIDYRTVLNYDLIEMDGGDPYADVGGGGNNSGGDHAEQQHGMRSSNAVTTNNSTTLKFKNDEINHRTHINDEGGDNSIPITASTTATAPGSNATTPVSLGSDPTASTAASTSASMASAAANAIDSAKASLYMGGDAPGGGGSGDYYGLAITWFKLVVFSLVLLCMLHFTTHFWMDHLGRGSIGAVFSFYGAVLVYIFLPLQSNRWLRRAFVIVVQRCFELVNPRCSCIFLPNGMIPRKIPFVDVFFADAMCSLSKVFFDWGMLLHQASHYPDPVPNDIHNIILPSAFAAVPYVIRARQCLIMYSVGRLQSDPKRYQHIANAIKYSTSLWPLILSAYQKTLSHEAAANLNRLLFFLLTINASYSLYWDIVMDWGMMQDTSAVVQTATANLACLPKGESVGKKGHGTSRDAACHHVCLRPRLRFGLTLSTIILVADSFLRFSWTLKLVGGGKLFPSNDAFVLCTQFLEVFRRAIWNLLRVEWENIKQKKWQSAKHKRDKAHDSLSDHEDGNGYASTDDEGDYDYGDQMDDTTGGGMEMKSLLGVGRAPNKIVRCDP